MKCTAAEVQVGYLHREKPGVEVWIASDDKNTVNELETGEDFHAMYIESASYEVLSSGLERTDETRYFRKLLFTSLL